jgi:hypothetical protein
LIIILLNRIATALIGSLTPALGFDAVDPGFPFLQLGRPPKLGEAHRIDR